MRAFGLLLVGLTWPLVAGLAGTACVQPNDVGAGALDARGDGVAAAEREEDAPGVEPESGPAPVEAGPGSADVEWDGPAGGTARDAGDAAAERQVLPLPQCSPATIGCSADGRAVQTCDREGQWLPTQLCDLGTVCSGGRCLCAPGACQTGTVHALDGDLEELAGGPGALYLAVNQVDRTSIRRVDLSSGEERTVVGPAPAYLRYYLDVDATGVLSWCSDGFLDDQRVGQVVSAGKQLHPGHCMHVRRRDEQVYFLAGGLQRRSIRDGAQPETLSTDDMLRFELAGDHLYYVGAPEEDTYLRRLPLDGAGPAQELLFRPDTIFLRLAVDAADAYVMLKDRVVQVPREGQGPIDDFWLSPGPELTHLVLGPAHVYFATTASGISTCSESTVWRRPKRREGPAVPLATFPGTCARGLVLVGDELFAGFTRGAGGAGLGSTQIVRLRP